MKWVLDFDDFNEENTCLNLFEALREDLPGFRATLFAVPALCHAGFREMMAREYPWLELVPHGWLHGTPRECENWTHGEAVDRLASLERGGWIRGWKSPGWNTSRGLYQALQERGWWIADHPKNLGKRPPGLRAYLLDDPRKRHFHVGAWNGVQMFNSISIPEVLGEIRALDPGRGFGLVSEEMA